MCKDSQDTLFHLATILETQLKDESDSEKNIGGQAKEFSFDILRINC